MIPVNGYDIGLSSIFISIIIHLIKFYLFPKGYFTAIMQEFIDIETPDFRKTVQVTPQLEDSLCHVCKGEVGPFFCKDFSCYQYYCTLCWKLKHSGPGFMHHQPLIRDSKHKPKLGPILSKFAALTFK